MTVLNKKTFTISNAPILPVTASNRGFEPVAVSLIDEASLSLREKGDISLVNKNEIQKIKEYAGLKVNWDSYDASPISSVAIAKSIEFIRLLDKFNEVVYLSSPGPNEEIMILLKKGDKEIEFIFYPFKQKFVQFYKGDYILQGDYTKKNLHTLIKWLNDL